MDKVAKIIVSLTSYPKRIKHVDKVVKTILIQTVKPDRIILWLSKEEFPNLSKDLPLELLELCQYGLEIEWVNEDLKSHKKYFYSIQKYHNDIVITVDDDVLYSPLLVETLYNSYKKYPDAVSCARVHLIKCDKYNNIELYENWEKDISYCSDYKLIDILAVGCEGVLYPPNCFDIDTLCNIQHITELCLYQDDLWLKVNEIIMDIPTVLAKNFAVLTPTMIDDSQESALCRTINLSGNDEALKKLNLYMISKINMSIEQKICLSKYTFEKLIEQKMSNILDDTEKNHSGDIYLYGAGKWAVATYQCLKKSFLGSRIKGFIVSSIINNPETLFELPVIELENMLDSSVIIIVSTSYLFRDDITMKLEEKGFKNIFLIDDDMMEEYLKSQQIINDVEKNFLFFLNPFKEVL